MIFHNSFLAVPGERKNVAIIERSINVNGHPFLTICVAVQVLYQLKILTTAFFSMILLHKPLNWLQLISLAMLVSGVSIVQLSGLKQVSVVCFGLGPQK